jgi:endonuclease-3
MPGLSIKKNESASKTSQNISTFKPTFTGEEVVNLLDEIYPKIKTPLSHKNPFQLLIATVLSAQSTDVGVNKVTPKLFKRFPTANLISKASIRELERLIKSTGFYHVKSRRIKEISRRIIADFEGIVPRTMEQLLTLPGVGRKTANIVLSAAYGKIQGIAVDTHVFRLSRRIGLSQSNTPEKIELDLMAITPKKLWPRLSMLLILHGRSICHARSPQCSKCVLNSKCLYYRSLQKSDRG